MPLNSNVHNLSALGVRRRRVFGMSLKTESRQTATELGRRLQVLADNRKVALKSEDDLFELSIDRTTIMIWAETPNSMAGLLDGITAIDANYRISARHVRYRTEPVLMEPVMWIDMRVPGLYESNVVELIASLAGRITQQKTIASGWYRIRAEAPLSELYDFSVRVDALCDCEARIDMGFSYYRNV